MKRIRVALGTVPQLVESIIKDILADNPDIEVIPVSETDQDKGYDVLVLNELEAGGEAIGYNSPSPASGIVMVGREGRTAAVFGRLKEELSFEPSSRAALEKAITLAAGAR